jgi:hypothetical protein
MSTDIARIESKLDIILSRLGVRDITKKYLTARDVQLLTGLDQRTILNRSNLKPSDHRFIPSVQLEGNRKYFERKVILRLFHLEEK